MAADNKQTWLEALQAALADGTFVKLTLGGARGRSNAVQNLFVRPVQLKDGAHLSFVYRHPAKDVTKNVTPTEGVALLTELVGTEFSTAHLFTTKFSLQLEYRSGREPRIIRHKTVQSAPADGRHDRPKQRQVDPRSRWLHGLGITTAEGTVRESMADKFRQIDKFVELLEHQLRELNLPKTAQVALVDMGCGKGYLTFAAYEYLRHHGWNFARARGIEARPELVELTNTVAKECGFDGLSFEAGTIDNATLPAVDILVALHACDTATDDAIGRGVSAGASLILVAPCCHKEVRPQLQPPEVLAPVVKHGILQERSAEMATDALRAALLECAGYRTQVFEFIATEHTGKNLMIAAVKRKQPTNAETALRQMRDLAGFYGIKEQRLATILGLSLEAKA